MLSGCTPWPEAFAAAYRDQGHWHSETLGELPRRWAQQFAQATALVDAGGRLSFQQLADAVDRRAAGFAAHGIRSGDRVVLQLPNVAEFVIVAFALFQLGAKPVFSLVSHRANEIGHLCRLSEAVAYVVPGQYRGFDHLALGEQMLAEVDSVQQVFVLGAGPLPARAGFVGLDDVDAPAVAAPVQDAEDVAFFLISGGTTALPKLIPRTHSDYHCQIRTVARVCEIGPQEVYLAALPVEFNFTWGCPGVVGTLAVGGTVVIAEDPTPEDCFKLIETEGVTLTSLVPSVAQLWVEAITWEQADLSSLRTVQIGGAKLHHDLAVRIGPALGCRLQQVFGMAEGLLSMTRADDEDEVALNTQGIPISEADEVRIVDEGDGDCPAGQIGELLVRGPYTLRGYYRAPEHNARAFTADGFYRSGDLARLRPDGRLVIEGRLKDVVIRGGDKISAGEVEGHLLTHEGVSGAAVVAAPHDLFGEQTYAFLVGSGPQPSLRELKETLRARGLADYKLPDRVEFIEAFPLTPLGKIDKKVLASAAADRTIARTWSPAPVA